MVSEIVDKKSEARKRMQAAIIGLLLLLSCWLILHEINPNLTNFSLLGIDNQNLNTTGANQSGTTQSSTQIPSPTNYQTQDASCKTNGGMCSLRSNQDGTYSCQCNGAL